MKIGLPLRLMSAALVLTASVAAFVQAARCEVTVGAMAELTGPFAKLGEDCRRGYLLAEEIDASGAAEKVPSRVVVGDNGAGAKTGLSEFQKLTQVDLASVIVTTRSPVGLAINPSAQKHNIAVIGIIGHPGFLSTNKFAIRVFPSAAQDGKALGDLVHRRGNLRVGIITAEDEYFLATTQAFVERLGNAAIAFSETIAADMQDFSSTITRMKGKNVDAVFVNVVPTQLPGVLKRLRQAGVAAQVFSNFCMGTPDVIRAAEASAEGVMFLQGDFEHQWFLDKLQSRFGERASSTVGYSCFLGLTTALQAISRLPRGSAASAAEISEELLHLDTVKLPDGELHIVEREAQLQMVERIIRNGKVERP